MATEELKFWKPSTDFIDCLSQWSELQNADQLVDLMCDKLEELKTFLAQDEIHEKSFLFLVKAISLASQSDRNRGAFLRVLNIVCQSPFLTQHITLYSEKVNDKVDCKLCQSLIIDIVEIFKLILLELPSFGFKVFIAASQLNYLLNRLVHLPSKDRLLNLLTNISVEAETLSRCAEVSKTKHNKFDHHKDTDEPPESFLEISVVPTAAELFQNTKPFVRKAIHKVPYKDVQHYLDVQFRLMKQDFMTPLKLALHQLRNKNDKNKFKCPDIRLYHDVRFIKTLLKNGYSHVLHINIQRLARVDWENSDRLMAGSLVCLSKDNFRTMIKRPYLEKICLHKTGKKECHSMALFT